MTLLETPRLVLREFTAADAEALFELNSDPRVTRYTDIAGQTPELATIRTVDLPGYRAAYALAPGYGVFAALERETQEFIGWFMLRPFRAAPYFDSGYPFPNDIELGYRLKFSAWGRGLASEGVKGLLHYGFETLRAGAVMALVLTENAASVKVLEKNGLTKLAYGNAALHFYRLERV